MSNNVIAYTGEYKYVKTDTLQVELLTAPMIDIAGKEKAAQIKIETHLILSMLFHENKRSFQDMNAELDKSYQKEPEQGKKRILEILSDPEEGEEGKSVLVQILGENKGNIRFRLTTNNISMADYYKDPSKTNVIDIAPESETVEEKEYRPVKAPDVLYTLKEKSRLETESILAEKAVSIEVDPETGERKYYKEGTPFIHVDAQAYVFEGKNWELPEGIEFPDYMKESMNLEEGGLVLITGPFYRKKEDAYYTSDVRELSDEEVYNIFKLRRVYDEKDRPFSIPVLGIAGRSILLPVSYKVSAPGMEKRHVFGLEFKNTGTPAYKAHNINNAFPATVNNEYVGKPGIFLNWEHQFGKGIPVGFGHFESVVMERELSTMEKEGSISRLTIGVMPWGGDNEKFPIPYGVSLRAPLSDYRRLMPAMVDYNNNPQKTQFDAVLEDLEMTPEEYLEIFPGEVGKSFRGIIDTGIIQGQHGSLINVDIFGKVTDLDDFMLIKEYDQRYSGIYVDDWVNNILLIIKLAADNDPYLVDKALNTFADAFFGNDPALKNLKELGPIRDNVGFLKNAIYKYLQRSVKKEISENKPEDHIKTEKMIDRTGLNSRETIRNVRKYLEKIIDEATEESKQYPVDIVVDLSLIPRVDMEQNAKTWAYLILSSFSMKNVNFTFKIPDLKEEKGIPVTLERERRGAVQRSEFEKVLRAEIRDLIPAVGMDGMIQEEIDKRINIFSREEAIQIPVISKATLEWMRESGQELEDNEYPVALDGLSFENDQRVLRNFEAALSIGLSQAALLIAKERDDGKTAEEEREFNDLKEKLLKKLTGLYKVVNENITFTEDTLDNMIYPDSAVRLNLAISLALPPITKAYYQELTEYYERIQLILHAA